MPSMLSNILLFMPLQKGIMFLICPLKCPEEDYFHIMCYLCSIIN